MPKQSANNAMPLKSGSLVQAAIRALALLACAALPATVSAAAADQSPAPRFDAVFNVKGEPASLHYQVSFAGPNGMHSLEVWRDGQSRLRRKTDDVLDTFVVRNPADTANPDEYQMTVVDYKRRITTRIDRNSLVRLGHFSEWFDLTHGLKHPGGAYRLTESTLPAGISAPLASCHWYSLEQGKPGQPGQPASVIDKHRICWSVQDRLPLMIWSEQRGVVWRVTRVSKAPILASVFEIHDDGFVRNDANQDIDND